MPQQTAHNFVHEEIHSGLKGNLSLTNITNLLQFLSLSSKKGVIELVHYPSNEEGRIYFVAEELVSAVSGQLTGIEGFADLLGWEQGSFHFHPDVACTDKTIGLNVPHAILEAATLLDHQANEKAINLNIKTEKRSLSMDQAGRDSSEVMNSLLEVPGVDAVVVVGRDGFVIESAGSSSRVNIEELGASLAHAINGIEEMGGELNVNTFQDMFIEYGRAVIMCRPVGDAVAALITPDASKLGVIRHKTKKLFVELGQSF
jgi:predicted regulator of Ras-like GTPase activity (Roadblock/LC7/MglB family)